MSEVATRPLTERCDRLMTPSSASASDEHRSYQRMHGARSLTADKAGVSLPSAEALERRLYEGGLVVK